MHGGAGLHGPLDDGHQLRTAGAQRIERAGLDQRFDRAAADLLGVDPFAKIEQAAERSVLCARADDGRRGRLAAALDRAQPDVDFAVGHGEVAVRTIDVGRQRLDVHPAAIFQMLDQRVLLLEVAAGDVAREQGRHELDRIVGLEIGRHVGDQGVGGRMALVEAVAGEFLDHAEQIFGLPLVASPWRPRRR